MMAITAMVLAACGGGGEDPAAEATEATQASPTETTGAPEVDDSDTEPAGITETDDSYALVTIDGTTYEFGENGPAATCSPDFFGGFFAVLYTEDLSGGFEVELWNDGVADDRSTTARMNVEDDGTTLDLEADPDGTWPAVEDGTSFVESFSYEGNRAEGTASFIDTEVAYNADLLPLDPILADFEVVCAED